MQEILGSTDIVEELDYRDQEVTATIKEEPLEEEQEELEEVGEDFSPLQRSRCNTWPRRRLAGGGGVKEEGLPLVCEEGREEGEEREEENSSLLPLPKSNSRRNPWGNFSYAELITQVFLY